MRYNHKIYNTITKQTTISTSIADFGRKEGIKMDDYGNWFYHHLTNYTMTDLNKLDRSDLVFEFQHYIIFRIPAEGYIAKRSMKKVVVTAVAPINTLKKRKKA